MTAADNILAVLETWACVAANSKARRELLQNSASSIRQHAGDSLSGGDGGELRLPEHWRLNRSLFFWMSRLQESILRPWTIFRA